jgi:fibronectin type 3 domain-containing protein
VTTSPAKLLLVMVALLIARLVICRKESQGHSVTLTWQASPSIPEATIVGYNLYRRAAPGTPYVRIATHTPGTAYEDRLVNGRMTYFYAVTAVDQHGRESRFSTVVRVEVP